MRGKYYVFLTATNYPKWLYSAAHNSAIYTICLIMYGLCSARKMTLYAFTMNYKHKIIKDIKY